MNNKFNNLSAKDQGLIEKVFDSFIQIGTSLIWSPKISKHLQFTFLWASNLQYIAIILWAQLGLVHLEDEDVPWTIFRTCKALLMKNMLTVGDNPLFVGVYLYFVFILTLIGFVSYKVSRNSRSQTAKDSIFFVGQFHLSFASWVINTLLLGTLTMHHRGTASVFHQKLNSSGVETIHILLLIVNYSISLILAFFSYDPFQGSNELSMHTPSFQVMTFLFKGVIVGFSPAPNSYDQTSVWIWTFLCFIISIIRHYNLVKTFPYYEYRPMNISLTFSLVSVLLSGLSCSFLVIRSFTSLSGITMVSIQVFLTVLVFIYQNSFLERAIRKLLNIQNKDLKSENDILKKIFALNYILSKTKVGIGNNEDSKTQDLLFWGLFYKTEDQFSSMQDPNEMNAVQRKYSSVINKMIYELLSSSLQQFKFNTKLKIFFANYILSKNINIIIGYSYLKQAMSNKLANQVIGTALLELYQQKVHRSFEDTLDVETLLESENMSNTFIKILYSNSVKYVEFWKSYCKPRLEIKDLLQKSMAIETKDMAIKKLWTKFTHKDKFFPNTQRIIYSIYLSLMRHTSYSSVLLEESTRFAEYENKQTSQQDRDITKETLPSRDNIIVHMSTAKDKVGKILNVSSNIAEQLGWGKNELTKKNIGVLFPHFVGGTQSYRLAEYHVATANNNATRFNKNIDSLICDKLGYIIPCRAYMCFHPDIKNELMYLLILRLQTLYEEQIMLNKDGSVLGFTRTIGRKLGLSTDEKPNIKDFCLNTESLDFLSNIKLTDRREVMLSFAKISLNEHDRVIIDFLVAITPFTYYNQEFYILKFLSDGSHFDNFLKELSVSCEVRKSTNSPKIKMNEEEDEEELIIPSEKALKETEAVLLSPHKETINSKPDEVLNLKMSYRFNSLMTSTSKEISPPKQSPNEVRSFRFASESSPRVMDNRLPEKHFQSTKATKVDPEENLASSLQRSNTKTRFEHALHDVHEDKIMHFFSILFVLLVLLAAILLFIFQGENTKAMATVTGNVEIVGASVTRLQRIINLYALCMYFVLLDLNKIFDNRFAYLGLPSLRAINYPRLKLMSQDLLDANTKIRNMMYRLDPSLTVGLNEEFPIMDFSPETGTFTSTRNLNSFDLITELCARTLRLQKTNPITSGNNTDIQFYIKNSINELLVHCEGGINVIVADTQVKLKHMDSVFLIITCILAGCGFLLLMLFLYRIRLFFSNREKALDIFRRLDEKEIIEHLNVVERFSLLLVKYDMDVKRISLQIKKENLSVKASTTKELQILRAKDANIKGTNFQIVKILFTLFLFFIIIYSGYLVTILVIKGQNVSIQRKIDLMVTSNLHFYELYMLWAITSQYIGQSTNITIRGNPANEEYNRVFANLADMNTDFLNVIDKDKGLGEDSLLVELFTGNLCQVAVSSIAAALGNPCFKILSGIATTGIVGIDSFFKLHMQQMKAAFDDSAQTYDDAVSLLNSPDFIGGQALVPGYLFTACDNANTQMQLQLSKDASKFTERVQDIVIGYIAADFVILMLVWYGLRKPFSDERRKWKNLLSNSKLEKSYKARGSGNGQGKMKNTSDGLGNKEVIELFDLHTFIEEADMIRSKGRELRKEIGL